MTKLTYDVKRDGIVIAKDVPTLAEAERIKAQNLGASLTRVYTPITEKFDASKLTAKQRAARVKL